ncbi:heme A synthase [Agromyces cerinus]|uniref:ABC transporter ATP-binding protein n=1 Tax=Agromyces cerinus TaxID=33878 RepID=UPI00195C78BF|nr:ABC transporter ATP-binding protein [Agromyces cerinus]MBM7832498.1 heme A synthase [Agromyces cerinus]
MTNTPGEYKPSRRDMLRPIEYVGGAAIAAVFTGVVVLVTARDLTLALIVAGIAFIAVLMTLALLSMAIKPNAEEAAEIEGETPDDSEGPAAPQTPGH